MINKNIHVTLIYINYQVSFIKPLIITKIVASQPNQCPSCMSLPGHCPSYCKSPSCVSLHGHWPKRRLNASQV